MREHPQMRRIFQASALLLAIAVFPLPTSTGVALSSLSLPEIAAQNRANATSGTTAALHRSLSSSPSPDAVREATHPLPGSDQSTATLAALGPDNDVIIVQTDIPTAEPAPKTPQPAPAAEIEERTPSRTGPIRPQAVITTDFEHNGLSESSFRTLARANTSDEPPEEKILVIGDSLSIPLGKLLEDYFSQLPSIHFKRLGKVSSGLARPDFFDWEKHLTPLAETMKPSTVVIMIGTNDNQSLKRPNGSTAHFGATTWKKEYLRRISRIFAILRENNPDVTIFWVGAPIMGRPELTRDVQRINTTIQAFCDRDENCHFIDTWDTLADDKGRFADFLVDNTGERVRVRASDGVHLSHSGARILASRCIQAMTPNVAVMQPQLAGEPSG